MIFQNLEQRMAHTYLDTFPQFKPAETGCSLQEQRSFYELMNRLYRLAYEEPALFVNQLHEDDAFTHRFNKSSENKVDLMKNMRLFTKAVDDLLAVMFQIGADRESARISKRNREILARLGVRDTGPLPSAWVWMCTRDRADILSFSNCLFDRRYSYTRDIYPKLLGSVSAFHRLESWMIEHGFLLYQYLDGRISMDYANPDWDPKPPRGGFQFKVRHTGISVNYDRWFTRPAVLGLCIPKGLKDCLAAFPHMDEALQSFIVLQSKKCDACNYCIQTDKTGGRPRAFSTVMHKAEVYRICPLFPGPSFCWTSIDDTIIDNVICMLSFMDKLLEQHR